MDWEAFWTAMIFVATLCVAGATIGLVLVGYQAAEWAKRTFGQTEEIEARRERPLVSIWAATMQYGAFGPTGFQELGVSLKWAGIIMSRGLQGFVAGTRLVCASYNLGRGPAVRVTVPYTLDVYDVIEDNSETFSDKVEGEFQIVHTPPLSLNQSLTYIDVTYFPKYRLQLHLDRVTVRGISGEVKNPVVQDTSIPVFEMRNRDFWDLARQRAQSQPSETTLV